MKLLAKLTAGITFCVIFIWISSTAGAVVVLSTDFTGRTVSGTTASNITWTENGLSAATSLTPVDPANTTTHFNLFDTASAQGHFAPIRNLETQGPWSVSIPVTVTGGPISLEGVDIDYQYFNGSGGIQGGATRQVDYVFTVTGSSSGLLGTSNQTESGSPVSGTVNMLFGAPLTLTNSETYTLELTLSSPGSAGNNAGFSALTFNGTAVPEPSTAVLLSGALGLFVILSLLRQRMRKPAL